jgi:hypothetical protein
VEDETKAWGIEIGGVACCGGSIEIEYALEYQLRRSWINKTFGNGHLKGLKVNAWK